MVPLVTVATNVFTKHAKGNVYSVCDLQIKNKKSEMINIFYPLQRPKGLHETNNKLSIR